MLLPLTLAPVWLQDIAKANPLSYAVNAGRAIFNDQVATSTVLEGVAIMAALAVIAVVVAARAMGRAVA